RIAALGQVSEQLLGPLEVETLTTEAATALVVPVDRLVRQATAVRVELAGRAAEAGALRSSTSGLTRSPDRWAADELGISRAQAQRDLRTADRLRTTPGTRAAFRAGDVSAEQAESIAEAATLAPTL